MRKDVEAECSEYVEVDAPDPGFGAGEPFDEGPAAFVPGATYLVPNNIESYEDRADDEDDKGEHLTEAFLMLDHVILLIGKNVRRVYLKRV